MPDLLYTAEVTRITQESPTVRRFFLRVKGVGQYDFAPGQFVVLHLPIGGEFSTRSYSIASAPNGTNELELCIVCKPDGAGTPYLFSEITEGSELTISEPQGKFILPETIDTDICFVSTGTGIAPFRAMAHYLLERGFTGNIYMIFGNRTSADILYKEEMEQLDARYPNFHFLPVLSREPGFAGAKGYVHPVYLQLFNDCRPALFYLCGWTTMVREAKNNLKELGYTRKEIKFELYD